MPPQILLVTPGTSTTPIAGQYISSAAAAASQERLERLKAMRVGAGVTDDSSDVNSASAMTGRRRQNVDEIRRRPPPAPKSMYGYKAFRLTIICFCSCENTKL